MSRWVLSVDLGTSYSLAAWWRQGRSVEVLDIGGERRVPSVVYVDDQRTVVGRIAEDLATADPSRALRTPKRRLGDPAPAVLGGRAHDVGDLVAALFAHIYNEAVRHHGSAPEVVRLTHPAAWGGARRQALVDAANRAGITNTHLVAEPVAAAVSYAAETTMNHGDRVLVYDLGGGTFDTAALESTPEGFVVIGRPGGDQTVGGELFDELLVNEIGERLDPATWDELQVSDDPTWRQTAARLRAEARRAKEALSSYPWVDVLVPLPSGIVQQRLTQADLRAIIEPHIADTVDILTETAAMAGLTENDIDAVYLVGGASRTPLVPELVSAAFANTTVSQRGDPKAAVATGAAHPNAAHGRIGHRRSMDEGAASVPPTGPPTGAGGPPPPFTPAPGGAPPPSTPPGGFVPGSAPPGSVPPGSVPPGSVPPAAATTGPPGPGVVGGPPSGQWPADRTYAAPPPAVSGRGGPVGPPGPSGPVGPPPVPGTDGPPTPPPSAGGSNTRWIVAAAVAFGVVLVIGGLAVAIMVLGSGDDVADGPDGSTTTTAETTTSTTPATTTPTTAGQLTIPSVTTPTVTSPTVTTVIDPGDPLPTTLDLFADPNYGVTSLTAGFAPDPYDIELRAGGFIDASYLTAVDGTTCRGWVTSAPDVELRYQDGITNLLRLYVTSDSDTTLIVNDPGGNWHCVDDAYGLDPAIDFVDPAGGTYDIWIGTYAEGAAEAGTFSITELDINHP
ncbi:MAG: Hsp70 family protein [Actinomycetota bacterium]|nr:Hsp70 family protein [Actinomycetota bacterium]